MHNRKKDDSPLRPESKSTDTKEWNLSDIKQQNENHNVKKVALGPNTKR
ncbi:MAG: hypothetical protein GX424_03735 [Clostridiales bacterium]|jgi:hypothetical protein|nr:hypothetical protein [Clostridiales bacterium]